MADIKQNGKIYIDDIFDEKDNINVLSFVPHLNIKDKDNCKLFIIIIIIIIIIFIYILR